MLTETVEDLRWNMTENNKLHRALVCDCPEPCACYCEGYAQGKDKAYFEMSNFDWTQHTKGCGCEPCSGLRQGPGEDAGPHGHP